MSNTLTTKNEAAYPVPGVPEQWAVRIFYFIGGFGTASWAPLVPLLRERLAITDEVLGLLLLCIGIGSLVTMPLSGYLASRYGCRSVLRIMALMFGVLLVSLAVVKDFYLTIGLLLVFGSIMGGVDVTLNIAAVIVEKASGKRLMSGMHAFWSIGGFAGAGLYGVWTGIFKLSALTSTLIAMAIMFVGVLLFSRHLIPYGGEGEGKLIAIPRGIVIAVGALAFVSFLVEGATMDWSGVFLTTIRHWDMSLAGMGFTIFSLAMLLMRLLGDATVNKLGAKLVVVGGALLAAAGFLTITVFENQWLTYAGFFAVGIGCANIVPVLFSLLGKQQDMPLAEAVAAMATMGYMGILIGPAAIGFVSHATSLYMAFIMLACLIVGQAAVAFGVYRKVEG